MMVGVSVDRAGPLGVWVDRLDAFIAALGAIDADDPATFCEHAWDIWESAAAADLPAESNPAMLVVVGVRQALAHVTALTYRSTAGARDRLPLSAVHASLTDELTALRRECERWRYEDLPSRSEVRERIVTAVTGLHVTTKRSA